MGPDWSNSGHTTISFGPASTRKMSCFNFKQKGSNGRKDSNDGRFVTRAIDGNPDPDVERFKSENEGRIQELRRWAVQEFQQADAELPFQEALPAFYNKAKDKIEAEWLKHFEHPKKEQIRQRILYCVFTEYVNHAGKRLFKQKPLQES